MTLSLDLTVHGDEAATLRMEEMAHRATDLRPLWRRLGPVLRHSEERKFAAGFTKSTVVGHELRLVGFGTEGEAIKSRARRRRSRYTLIDSGRLKESLTLLGGENVMDEGLLSLRFGTSVFYAKFLRERGFRLIPVTQQLRREMTRTALDYFMGR